MKKYNMGMLFVIMAVLFMGCSTTRTIKSTSLPGWDLPYFVPSNGRVDLKKLKIAINVVDKRSEFKKVDVSNVSFSAYPLLEGVTGKTYFEDYLKALVQEFNGRNSVNPSAVPLTLDLEVLAPKISGFLYYSGHGLVQFTVHSSSINKRYSIDLVDGDADAPIGKSSMVSPDEAKILMISGAMCKAFKAFLTDVSIAYPTVSTDNHNSIQHENGYNQDASTQPATGSYAVDINGAWVSLLSRSDAQSAIQRATKILNSDSENYKAHEILFQAYKMMGKYEEMLPHLIAMYKQDKIENLAYGDQWMYTKDLNGSSHFIVSPQQLADIKNALETAFAANVYNNPYMIRLATDLLGNVYAEMGEYDKAVEVEAATKSNIDKWIVIGPFENGNQIGFDEIYPPEVEIEVKKEYRGMNSAVQWREVKQLGLKNELDIGSLYDLKTWFTAYALTYIYSPEAKDALINIGCDDACKAWFNDALIIAEDHYKEASRDQFIKKIRVNKGWNKILLKACARGRCVYQAIITDPQGNIMRDLQCDVNPGKYQAAKDAATATVLSFESKSLQEYYENEIRENPKVEANYYYLAHWLAECNNYTKAVGMYEHLVNLNPSCALYYYEAGLVYFKDGLTAQAIKAFKKAIALYPDYTEAYYAIGRCYMLKGLIKDAEDAFNTLLEINPKYADAYLALAYCSESENQLDEALKQIKRAIKMCPDYCEAYYQLGVYRKYQRLTDSAVRAFQYALSLQKCHAEARRELSIAYADQGKFSKAIKENNILLKMFKLPSISLASADCYLREGEFDAATAECNALLEKYPDNANIYATLGDIYNTRGDREKAVSFWKKTLQCRPDYYRLREYMYKLFPEENYVVRQFQITPEKRTRILREKFEPESNSKAVAVKLLRQSIIDVHEDASYTENIYELIKILNEEGRKALANIPLPKGDSTSIKKVLVLLPDGREVAQTSIVDNTVSFSNLQPGAIIELQYSVNYNPSAWNWVKNNFYYSSYFNSSIGPILTNELYIAMPRDKEVKVFVSGENIKSEKTDLRDKVIYSWTANAQKQLIPEKHSPSFDELADKVKISTIASWDDIARWENRLLKDQLLINDEINDKIAALTKGLSNIDDKIKALYVYVAKNINYNQRQGEPIYFIRPHKAIEVFDEEYGVCKDKAILLIAMLRAIDVKAHYALLLTKDYGKLINKITCPDFNHAIVYIEAPSGGVFVDPTNGLLSYADLFYSAQGVDALVCKADGYEFITTPGSIKYGDHVKTQQTIVLDNKGRARIKTIKTYSGPDQSMERVNFALEGRRREELESSVNEYLPGAIITTSTFSNIDDLSEPVRMQYEMEAPNCARISGDVMYVKALNIMTMTKDLAEMSQRKYPLVLACWKSVNQQEFVIPKGYSVKSLPDNASIESPFGLYTLKYEMKKNKIIRVREYVQKADRIDPDGYSACRNFYTKVDAEEGKEMILLRN